MHGISYGKFSQGYFYLNVFLQERRKSLVCSGSKVQVFHSLAMNIYVSNPHPLKKVEITLMVYCTRQGLISSIGS